MKKNPIRNSLSFFSSPWHHRCSDALVSVGETNARQFMIQFSKNPKRLFPAGFAHATMRIEIAFDESVKNYRKRHFFLHTILSH